MYFDDPKSLRVHDSLALQACSLLTTKQFNHRHFSFVEQDKAMA